MSHYTNNTRAQKGESRGTNRDYAGRFQPSYVNVIRERLANLNKTIAYYESEFRAAQAKGDGQRIGFLAIELDRARKQAGRFEVIIEQETKGAGE